jgi:hypothetical protein
MQRRNLSFLSLQQLWTPELPLFQFTERTKETVTLTSVLCTLEQPRVRTSNRQASANKNEWQTSIRTLERTCSINTLEVSVHMKDKETSIWTYKHLKNRCHIRCAGSIPDGVTRTFHRHNFVDRTMALGSNQPQEKWVSGLFSGVGWGWGGE